MSKRPPTPEHPADGSRPRRAPMASAAMMWAVLAIVPAIAASCSATGGGDPVAMADSSAATPGVEPVDRVAAVVTTGCGSASAAIGSAVRLDDTTVLTVAHVVAGARDVAVVDGEHLPTDREWPGFSPMTLSDSAAPASVVAFDPDRDLALLVVDDRPENGPEFQRPEFGVATVGDPVEIHGAATSAIEGSVAQRTTIVANEVRGRRRVERDGYRLDAATTGGDSGAGVWSPDGRLVGLVFAVSVGDGTRTWAVSGPEISGFLNAAQEEPATSYRCDEISSRLVADG